MENKISGTRLAAMLAIATGEQVELCEKFINALSATVEEELCKGDSVRIKGFGTFKIVDVEARRSVNIATGEECEIPGHKKGIFVMSKELAAMVNAPFEAFEAVEIADEIPTDTLDGDADVEDDSVYTTVAENAGVEEYPADKGAEEQTAQEASFGKETEKIVNEDTLPEVPALEEEVSDGSQPESEGKTAESDGETNAAPADSADSAVIDIPEEVEDKDKAGDEDETSGRQAEPFWRRYRFLLGFITGVCAAALICWVSVGIADYLTHRSPGVASRQAAEEVALTEKAADKVAVPMENGNQDSSVSLDSVGGQSSDQDADATVSSRNGEVATEASDPVYDTVTTTRYLTTIAKEHYGNFNLWPIIYEENAAILGHPDRIRPGTRVVVPPLSKYGIDPSNEAQVKEVKRKGVAIYAKFK